MFDAFQNEFSGSSSSAVIMADIELEGQEDNFYITQFQLRGTTKPEKAIVYMGNNLNRKHFNIFNASIRSFFTFIKQKHPNLTLAAYYPDYAENTDLNIDTQIRTINYLLQNNFKPEDILIIGHSCGVNLAIDVLTKLGEENPANKAIKFISDTDYVLESNDDYAPDSEIEIYTNEAKVNLIQKIVTQFPSSIIFHLQKSSDFLASSFIETCPNILPFNPKLIHSKNLNAPPFVSYVMPNLQLKPAEIIISFIAEETIKLHFSTPALSENKTYVVGDTTLEFLTENCIPMVDDPNKHLITSMSANILLERLHNRCLELTNLAAANGKGASWATLFSRNKIHHVREIIKSAIQIMHHFSSFPASYRELLAYTAKINREDLSDTEGNIINDIVSLIQAFDKIRTFNEMLLNLNNQLSSIALSESVFSINSLPSNPSVFNF